MLWWRLQQLRSIDWKVRSQAAEKLGESGDQRAVPALVKALEDKDRNVREAAAGALGNIGNASAVDPLLETLRDSDRSVRRSAAEALGRIGDERVIERLLPLLKDKDSDLRSAVAKALETMGGRKLNDTLRAACAVARMKWDEAASIGEPAIEPLIEALDDMKTQIRVAAIQALEKIGHERSIEPLIRMLKDDDTKVQEAACWALAASSDKRAVMPLISVARGSYVANVAAAGLGRLVERIAPSIPDADLVEIAHLNDKPEVEEPLTAYANVSSSSPAIDFSNVSNVARQELIRRGLLSA